MPPPDDARAHAGDSQALEAAWLGGTTPALEHFLPPPGSPGRAAVLRRLLALDLECRWRRHGRAAAEPAALAGLPACPRLEDYAAAFPELGPAAALPLEMVADEYHARQRHGDRPARAEYERRFPGREAELRAALDRMEAALHEPCSIPAVAGYEVLRLLGRGGMGVVFTARQVNADRVVALKLVGDHGLGGAGRPGALQGRGRRRRGPPATPQYRAGLRGRRAGQAALLFNGAVSRLQPGPAPARRPAAGQRGGGVGGGAGTGGAARPRARRRPPRPQAR